MSTSERTIGNYELLCYPISKRLARRYESGAVWVEPRGMAPQTITRDAHRRIEWFVVLFQPVFQSFEAPLQARSVRKHPQELFVRQLQIQKPLRWACFELHQRDGRLAIGHHA